MTIGAQPNSRSDDRIFVLTAIDGQKMKDPRGFGITDSRLFTGENKIHAKKDPETCLWFLKYEYGVVPEPLKCQFTTFSAAKKFTEAYYATRNLKITEVID
jgi:hypothetical protein